ncbi:bacteriohemerythrin [Clostridium chromiireducens]|uniref:Bacteriohemerythrin n=1 Tax=Clostridium chromiireducens TaxID=225345 RepID=A0A964RRQ2_9CLOT|nr:hemerythrin family protein [Clostridium chromiireducens]MVX66510.1 bacteriohemerythrin [Clostridium chromiireducens]
MLTWKEEYSIGIEIIDEQHKHLFEIGNQAYGLLKNELRIDKYDDVVQILEDLRQYTKFHFQTEETYMLKINSDQLPSQKIEHAEFIKKIFNIDFRSLDANTNEHLNEILFFILNWILDHVLHKDKLIAQR